MLKALFRADFLHLASLFRSTEGTRYYLNGVYVEPAAGGGVVLVATDGHRLCVFHDAEGFIDTPSIVVPPMGLAGVMAAKCRRSAAYLGFIGEAAGYRRYGRICTLLREDFPKNTDGTIGAEVARNHIADPLDTLVAWQGVVQLIDGDYPDWRRVVPQPSPSDSAAPGNEVPAAAAACIANGNYLAPFVKVAKALQSGTQTVRIFPSGVGAPVRVDVGCPEFIGILMPMRDCGAGPWGDAETGGGAPAWAFERPAKPVAQP